MPYQLAGFGQPLARPAGYGANRAPGAGIGSAGGHYRNSLRLLQLEGRADGAAEPECVPKPRFVAKAQHRRTPRTRRTDRGFCNHDGATRYGLSELPRRA